jgi:hypothetical protein
LEVQSGLEAAYGDPHAADAKAILIGQRDRLLGLVRPHLEAMELPVPSSWTAIQSRYQELMAKYAPEEFAGYPARFQELVRLDRQSVQENFERLRGIVGRPGVEESVSPEATVAPEADQGEPGDGLEAALREARRALVLAAELASDRWSERLLRMRDSLDRALNRLGPPEDVPMRARKGGWLKGLPRSPRTAWGREVVAAWKAARQQGLVFGSIEELQAWAGIAGRPTGLERGRPRIDSGPARRPRPREGSRRGQRKGGWLKGLPRNPKTPEDLELVANWRAARERGLHFGSIEELRAWAKSGTPGDPVDEPGTETTPVPAEIVDPGAGQTSESLRSVSDLPAEAPNNVELRPLEAPTRLAVDLLSKGPSGLNQEQLIGELGPSYPRGPFSEGSVLLTRVRLELPLSELEVQVLEALARHGRLTEKDLAASTGRRRIGGVVETLSLRLEEAGKPWLVCEGTGDDGRVYSFRRP